MKKFVVMCMAVLLVLLASAIAFVSTVQTADSPYQKAREEAIRLVIGEGLMTQVDQFYWYQANSRFYGLLGKDQESPIYLIVDVNEAKAYIYEQKDLLDERAVRASLQDTIADHKVLNISLKIENEEPVWEVAFATPTSSLGYMTLSAKTGQILRDIRSVLSP